MHEKWKCNAGKKCVHLCFYYHWCIISFYRKDIYTKLPSDFNEYKQDKIELVSDVSVDDLIDAFKKFLERQKDNIVLETKVTKKGISIEQRRAEIKNIIFKRRKVNFFELFDVLTREYLVVTFLAILEMTRKREINIKQENNFDEIICEVA